MRVKPSRTWERLLHWQVPPSRNRAASEHACDPLVRATLGPPRWASVAGGSSATAEGAAFCPSTLGLTEHHPLGQRRRAAVPWWRTLPSVGGTLMCLPPRSPHTQLLPQPWVGSESWIKRKDLVQQITQEVEVSVGLFQSNWRLFISSAERGAPRSARWRALWHQGRAWIKLTLRHLAHAGLWAR